MVNYAAVAALDLAWKKYLAKKYGLVGKDDEGRGIYKVTPDQWAEGDLDCIVAWSQWMAKGDRQTQNEMEEWLIIAHNRGVDLSTLERLTQKKPMPMLAKVGIGVAGFLGLRWLLSGPKPIPESELVTTEHIGELVKSAYER